MSEIVCQYFIILDNICHYLLIFFNICQYLSLFAKYFMLDMSPIIVLFVFVFGIASSWEICVWSQNLLMVVCKPCACIFSQRHALLFLCWLSLDFKLNFSGYIWLENMTLHFKSLEPTLKEICWIPLRPWEKVVILIKFNQTLCKFVLFD